MDDDGRRLDGYTISSPCEPYGSGELKMSNNLFLTFLEISKKLHFIFCKCIIIVKNLSNFLIHKEIEALVWYMKFANIKMLW